jgi:hypothetical protein
MIETPLGKALRAHRDMHPGCDRHCQEYLAITNQATATRVIQEGPVARHTWLSVREATNV